MSMSIGPIHYWLYKKIGNQEDLTAFIAEETRKNGWISDTSAYTKELPALESVIDEAIYQYFEDFFLNGMPCDRVNEIIEQTEEKVSWQMNQDIHAEYWSEEKNEEYYELRKAVMDGMLDDSDFNVEMQDLYRYTLGR